jgi:hypothetical protein
MPSPSMGSASQMCLSATSTFNTSSSWIEFISESIMRHGVILSADDAIRGTRSRAGERIRSGPYKISGSVSLYPDKNNLDLFLAYILGSGPSSQVYSLAETLPSFYLMIDRGTKVFVYNNCYVGKAVLKGSAGDPKMKLTLDIEAETVTVNNAGTFPAITALDTTRPYIFSDLSGGLSIGGTTYSCFDWELTIDNVLDGNRFVNELTRSQIPPKDREIRYKITVPYTSAEAALLGVAPGAFGSITSVFTDAEEVISSTTSTLTITSPLFIYPTEDPVVTGKANETKLTLNAMARKSGTTAEISITNAHG